MSAPFTQEQLEYLAERDGRLVESCGHGFRKGIKHLRNGALAGFLVLLAGIAGAFYASGHDASQANSAIVKSGRVVSVSGCNRDYVTVNRLRNVLKRSEDFQHAALARGDISLEQFERSRAYFDQQLDGLPQVDCRSSATIITDDPNDIGAVPKPLHPPEPPYAGPH